MDFFQKLALEKTKETPIRIWFYTLVEFSGGDAKILRSFSQPAKDSFAKFGKKSREKKIIIEDPMGKEDLFG
jgi:hypothetical protein